MKHSGCRREKEEATSSRGSYTIRDDAPRNSNKGGRVQTSVRRSRDHDNVRRGAFKLLSIFLFIFSLLLTLERKNIQNKSRTPIEHACLSLRTESEKSTTGKNKDKNAMLNLTQLKTVEWKIKDLK